MDDLRNILPTGKSNAISARELAAKNWREVIG